MLTRKQLAAELDCDVKEIDQMVEDGLPHTGKTKRSWKFDPDLAADWIAFNRAAVPQETICRTKAELANELNVNLRTVGNWLTDPTFPGKVGEPGKRNSYFPLLEIKQWLSRNGKGNDASLGEAAMSFREKLNQLDYERRLGSLVDRQEVVNLFVRTHAIARQRLQGFVPRLVQLLPADTPEPVLLDFRERLQAEVDRFCQELGSTLEQLDLENK